MATRASGAGTNGYLDKQAFLSQFTVGEEDFAMPGGGSIRVRGLGVNEYFSVLQVEDQGERIKRFCLLGIVEPHLDPDDLDALANGKVGVVTAIGNRIISLSAIVGEDEADGFFGESPSPKPSSSTARKNSGGSRRRSTRRLAS